MTAHAYLRASTSGQDLSPAAQREAIEAWSARSGTSVVAWYEDRGVSGTAPVEKRPALVEALGALKRGSVLIVARRDRLARDVLVAATIEATARKRGASVVSADGAGNGDGPADALMRSMLDAFAAFERALIATRTKAALAVRSKAGLRVSRFPRFGFRHEDGRLVPDPKEQATLARYRELLASGLTRGRALRRLRAEGHTNRVGKPVGRDTLAGVA